MEREMTDTKQAFVLVQPGESLMEDGEALTKWKERIRASLPKVSIHVFTDFEKMFRSLDRSVVLVVWDRSGDGFFDSLLPLDLTRLFSYLKRNRTTFFLMESCCASVKFHKFLDGFKTFKNFMLATSPLFLPAELISALCYFLAQIHKIDFSSNSERYNIMYIETCKYLFRGAPELLIGIDLDKMALDDDPTEKGKVVDLILI
jgi:hypothetical protein